MCLYPKLIRNRKYTPNNKNKGNVPICTDERVKMVPVGCGNCIECRNQKKREWQIRMNEEVKNDNSGKFITLTFSNDELIKLMDETGIVESNAIAAIAVRRFLERWRKKFKKSVKHWLVTELGHENTERIHMHGILFTNVDNLTIEKLWKYGNVWIGDYVNGRTVNYIIKYITKIDQEHKNYKPIILTSAGIGKGYLNKWDVKNNKFKGDNTDESYKLPNGMKSNLPIYYRNKIYNETQREMLWLNKLDKEIRWVLGKKIDVSTEAGMLNYYNALNQAQKENRLLGFGNDGDEWKKESYNITVNMLRKAKAANEHNLKSKMK